MQAIEVECKPCAIKVTLKLYPPHSFWIDTLSVYSALAQRELKSSVLINDLQDYVLYCPQEVKTWWSSLQLIFFTAAMSLIIPTCHDKNYIQKHRLSENI